ncbi:MAG: RNA polymerase sigma factor [Flavobacteriales bacterium]|nr:RNA polymerase sigma factor [Flavobacteriales bacterium]
MEDLSDDEIIDLIINQKQTDYFQHLYLRYSPVVYNKCIALANDKDIAKDLTHDIFLKVFLNLSKFKSKSKFSTWLYSITYNFCIDFLKKEQKQIEKVEEIIDITDEEDEDYEKQLLEIKVDKLQQVLDSISIEDKSILLMKYQDDYSIKEIQNILGLSESAVKMRIKRAKAKAVDTYKNLC